MKPWYQINEIEKIDSPSLVIYLDRVKKNIENLKGMIDDVRRLRPHVKTHKTKEAALLLREASINKFKCATIAEAEMLGAIHAPDVLLAYQPVGPKVERFISLLKNYPATKFSCLVDNSFSAQHLSGKAVEANLKIPVYIDLNIGMNRTGISSEKDALKLYKQCTLLQGVEVVGLHAYDGHIHEEDIVIREKKCHEAFALVESLRAKILENDFAEPVIVIGGSPTFPFHAKRKNVECSPGTFIFWDAGYQQTLTEQPFLPAALVISRVISLPTGDSLCTDLGHKSVAAENELSKRICFLNAPELKPVSQSEEHLVLKTNMDHDYKPGDVLYGLPYHICPTCALYERAVVVEEGDIISEWKIVARDRKIDL
jgi:D-serine deaminase-like pyridoxal phosphate-dependent protein